MAIAAPELTLTVVASPLTRPIIDGEVTSDGVALRAQAAVNIDNVTRRMLQREYDIGEMSLARRRVWPTCLAPTPGPSVSVRIVQP